MPVARKPKIPTEDKSTVVDVEALIRKGGSVASEVASKEEAVTPVILRLPGEILGKVDQAVKARRIKTPRHTWLVEAVLEKLEREGQSV